MCEIVSTAFVNTLLYNNKAMMIIIYQVSTNIFKVKYNI